MGYFRQISICNNLLFWHLLQEAFVSWLKYNSNCQNNSCPRCVYYWFSYTCKMQSGFLIFGQKFNRTAPKHHSGENARKCLRIAKILAFQAEVLLKLILPYFDSTDFMNILYTVENLQLWLHKFNIYPPSLVEKN